jgi:hypothetical protein
MAYSVRCSCGNAHEVSATQAGTEISCGCGAVVLVPLLSQLRVSAGQEAYESGIVDKILRLKSEGKLPLGDHCLLSGQRTEDTALVRVQCERSYDKGPPKYEKFLAILSFFFIGIFAWFVAKETLGQKPEWVGRDLELSLPIRVHRDLRDDLQKIRNQKRLRELLRAVPLYAQLLDDYPSAEVWPC